MSTAANNVMMTVNGTPGTGTVTLLAASANMVTFLAAYGAVSTTVDVRFQDGTAWEIARDCTYNGGSPGTVTRGTRENSSTGSALSLTSAATVEVVLPASAINNYESAALNSVAGADANTTLVPNTLYETDMSGWATASRDYTLPTTATVGQEIDVAVNVGNATYALILKTGTGQTCAMGGSVIAAATEITRLFITGERMRFRYYATNKWRAIDGRIPCSGGYSITTGSSATGAATSIYLFTAFPSATGTASTLVGFVASGGQVTTRRSGTYIVNACYLPGSNVADAKYVSTFIYVNGAIVERATWPSAFGSTNSRPAAWSGNVAAGQTLDARVRAEEANMGISTESFWFATEVL